MKIAEQFVGANLVFALPQTSYLLQKRANTRFAPTGNFIIAFKR